MSQTVTSATSVTPPTGDTIEDRLGRVLHAMLEFSRTNASALETMIRQDINDLVADMTKGYRSSATVSGGTSSSVQSGGTVSSTLTPPPVTTSAASAASGTETTPTSATHE